MESRVSLLPGNYNSNSTVKQGDLNLVLLNWGEELIDPYDAGWINDLPAGPIDQDELNKVLLNWGSTAEPLAPVSIPEPPVLLLAVASLPFFAMPRLLPPSHRTSQAGEALFSQSLRVSH